ncbi:hypothetical protein DSO57_1001701 [Entomophthora muscae]|uniref:Uncharacterized protein n=1 Tax=Entomophthora muscae TaxID=34485 RepID=A0ACC2SM65_9FUNG|nr:hypothetical protein DSO57_1001701 [Entomophthora muscae]
MATIVRRGILVYKRLLVPVFARYSQMSTNTKSNKTLVPPLCSPSWLVNKLNEKDIVLLDASWHMPNQNRNGKQEFLIERIGAARFFDLDEACDKASPYPHMLPSPQQFSEYMESLSVSPSDHIVIYDAHGIFSSCRAFWTLKGFGHEKVSLLNGGLARWKAEGFPVTTASECSDLVKSSYSASEFDKTMVVDYSCVAAIAASTEPRAIICDARSNDRFTGKAPEPRKGLSSGHMPSSKSISFDQVLKPGDASHSFKVFKSPEELQEFFVNAGLSYLHPIITTCGTGITACILEFALKYGLYYPENSIAPVSSQESFNVSVYDGSWTEYASKQESIIHKD